MKLTAALQRTLSTTLAVGSVNAPSSSPTGGKVSRLLLGSEATPGDTAILWKAGRCSTVGAGGGAVTLGVGEGTQAGTPSWTAEQAPTTTPTAVDTMLVIPLNQRNTYEWVAYPGRDEILLPNTASNGFDVRTPTSTAIAGTALVSFEQY